MALEVDLGLKPNCAIAGLAKCVNLSKLEFSSLQSGVIILSPLQCYRKNLPNTFSSMSGMEFSNCFELGQERGILLSSGPSNFTFGVLAKKI